MSDDHSFYWRTLLGPAVTEELIAQSYGDIESDKAQRRKVRSDKGSKKAPRNESATA